MSIGLSYSMSVGNPALNGSRKIVPANSIVAWAGDSRTQNGFDVGTAGRWFLETRGGAAWARAYSGNVFTLSRTQYGVGGDTTTMLLARWSDVINSGAGSVVLLISANDRGAADMTAAATKANITDMLDQAEEAGLLVFLCDEIPRDDISGTQLANHVEVHEWLRLQGRRRNVIVVPTWAALLDPATDGTTYKSKAGTLADQLHPGSYGGLLLGQAIGTTMRRALRIDLSTPWVSGESVSSPALNSNPGMTGTGGTKGTTGTVTGEIADNWRGDFSSGNTSMVCNCTFETIGGLRYQVLTFSGTSSTTSTFTLRPTTDLSLVEGENFDMRARIILGASSSNVLGVVAEARSDGTVLQQSRTLDGYTSPDTAPSVGFDVHAWTPPCAVAATPTTKRGQIVVTFTPSSTVSAVVKIAAAAAREII